jgi:hypothetical protein
MLNRRTLALAAALGIVCLGTTAAQGVTTEDSRPPEVYYALHNGTWFDADSPVGPWVLADYVPPALYTIPPGCPIAQDGILCVYNDPTEYVGDFSGWPWAWSFDRDFRWLPSAVVIDRAAPGTTRADTFVVKSPRGEARSEPRSEPRSIARSAPRDERP